MIEEETRDVETTCEALRKKLEKVLWDLSYNGSTLSGGLDTSIINYIASKMEPDLKCVSIGFEESRMEDLKYARIAADELDLEQCVYTFNFDEAMDAAREVIRIMESFDPMEIRNSIPIYIAMDKSKELGFTDILTGDGADELFAGYSFLYNLPIEELHGELERIWKTMRFSSQLIAKSLEINAVLPYIEERFREFAMDISLELKVGERNNNKIGKWILRKAYEGLLPDEIIWRKKAPIEVGTGTRVFPEKFDRMVGDKSYDARRKAVQDKDNVTIRSKEQLFYYEIFRSIFGPPKPENPEDRACPYCTTNVPEDARFCRMCGSNIQN